MSSSDADRPVPTALSAATAIRLVAVREIRTRVMTRAFVIGNAVFIALIVGALGLTAALVPDPGKPVKVGVVGVAKDLGPALDVAGAPVKVKVELRPLADDAAGRRALLDGKVKVVIVPEGGGFVVRTDKKIDPALQAVVSSAVQQRAVAAALRAEKVDPNALSAAAARAKVEIRYLHPPKKDADQRTAITFAIITLLYAQLFNSGFAVANGVVEEKMTRLAELLLGAIKPVHLMAGKVLGIGTVGLVQLAAFGAVGLTAGAATGVLDLTAAAVVAFVSALGWYVLGFLFFGSLYAAAASLVSKQEEVGSAVAPLAVLIIAMFGVAQASVSDPSGHLSNVMSWIPPFSAILMPLRIAAGVASPLQVVGTAALMLVTSTVLSVVAGRIYQASILRSGQGFPWKRKRRGSARDPAAAPAA